MFSSKFDIRLVISVVITCVNLNKMNVHVKNLKIKDRQYIGLGWLSSMKQWELCVTGIVAQHK